MILHLSANLYCMIFYLKIRFYTLIDNSHSMQFGTPIKFMMSITSISQTHIQQCAHSVQCDLRINYLKVIEGKLNSKSYMRNAEKKNSVLILICTSYHHWIFCILLCVRAYNLLQIFTCSRSNGKLFYGAKFWLKIVWLQTCESMHVHKRLIVLFSDSYQL